MKPLLILLSIAAGYFLPVYAIKSLSLFVVAILFALYLGWEIPYIMSKISLARDEDLNKVTVRTRISLVGTNSQSLWIGIFFCVTALTSLVKVALVHHEIGQVGIFLLAFGAPAVIKVYDFRSGLKRS
ncbi:MAG TPA: hypothetical protein VIS48_00825 [Candidatus Kryptonia bacterium]